MPSLDDVIAPRDAPELQRGLGRAVLFAQETAAFIDDEELSSADASLFFGWRKPRPIAAMVSVFVEMTRTDLLKNPELGVVLVVPLRKTSSLGADVLPLDELARQTWLKEALPEIHIGRRRALNGFENVPELRTPLAWAGVSPDISVFHRSWQSESSSEAGLFENAFYCRYFLSEGDGTSFTFGLPPLSAV